MPKDATVKYPLNGLIGINKVSPHQTQLSHTERKAERKAHSSPSSRSHTSNRQPTGQTSNAILAGLKRLGRNSVLFKESKAAGVKARGGITKIGQGGTLDPLADGVLGQLYIFTFALLYPDPDP